MHKDLIWYDSIFSAPPAEGINESLPKSLSRLSTSCPASAAVLYNDRTYSFHELGCRVAGLAAEINEFVSRPGPVALVQSVGFDAVAAWFACSLSGKPFVLLEPDHPPSRLLELIEAAGCALVLCDHITSQALLNFPQLNLLIPGDRLGTLMEFEGLAAEDPAMIFPTSGSTGKPKLITYSATTMQIKVQSSIMLMNVSKGERVLIAGSPGNYGFLHHALVFLFSGGTLCLADIKAGGFASVLQAIEHQGVRHVRFTPSMFRKLASMPQSLESLKLLDGVRFSGEPLLMNDLSLARSVLKKDCLIQNIYGSTESALFIWSSDNSIANETESTVPIGRIYPFASYAILPIKDFDQDWNTGELLISSAFNALGDIRDGKIDEERFPLSEENSNERIFSTGDVVRQLPDGCLIHLGRIGRMIKIRGHRVFLTEVENHLRAIPGVTGAAVVEHSEQDRTVLYGFITSDTTYANTINPRSWLAERLPDFMLPRVVLMVQQIPLMPGGKVDYSALLTRIHTNLIETNFNNSIGDDFVRLVQLWNSILGAGVHAHDGDFHALGGDSLGLMTLAVEVERIFGKRLPIEQFTANSTLQNLAHLLGINPGDLSATNSKTVQAKFFSEGTHPSKGIALAMPGVRGWAQVMPMKQSGLLTDYDLWGVSFLHPKGSMLQSKRWWRAAVEIAEGIKAGSIPLPRIIFGFSFGGGLAWLVSRLLAGTPQCPKFILMVDSPPFHRLKTFRNTALTNALNTVSHINPPPVLHIRKTALPNVGVGCGSTHAWELEDNIRMFVDLPTVDHLEMSRWDMLSLAAEPVALFLNGQYDSSVLVPAMPPPDTLGVKIHHAVIGDNKMLETVLNEFKSNPNNFSLEQLTTLVFLMYFEGNTDTVSALLQFLLNRFPCRMVKFLNLRLGRDARMLLFEHIPSFYPYSIVLVETTLARAQRKIDNSIPRQIKLIYFAIDVSRATFGALWARYLIKQ